MSRFDTSIFAMVQYLLDLNIKANVVIGSDTDLENKVLCYQGCYGAFEDEAIRVDAMYYWCDDYFKDNSDDEIFI